jgi:hypothetical protein
MACGLRKGCLFAFNPQRKMSKATIALRSSFPTAAALTFATVFVTLSATTASQAAPLPAYPTTGAGPSTTAWYPDRYAPAGFANVGSLFGRNNVLAITIDDADNAASRPPAFSSTFYNTQGRKVDVDTAPPVTWIGSLYIPSAWATTNPADPTLTRQSDMWATLSDATDSPVAYPIIGFTNRDPVTLNGGTPRYRVWDSVAGWTDLPQAVTYDAWTNFAITFTGTTIEYRINGTLVYTDSDPGIAAGTVASDIMLQAYNFGFDYVANWSFAGYGQRTSAQLFAEFQPLVAAPAAPVPVGPLAPALSALAIGLAALRLRRRR